MNSLILIRSRPVVVQRFAAVRRATCRGRSLAMHPTRTAGVARVGETPPGTPEKQSDGKDGNGKTVLTAVFTAVGSVLTLLLAMNTLFATPLNTKLDTEFSKLSTKLDTETSKLSTKLDTKLDTLTSSVNEFVKQSAYLEGKVSILERKR